MTHKPSSLLAWSAFGLAAVLALGGAADGTLGADLVTVTYGTMQPAVVSLWLGEGATSRG